MKKFNLKARFFDATTFAFLILTVLVGILEPTEEQQLNLNFNASLTLVLFLLGFLLSYLLNRVHVRTWGEQIFLPSYKKAQEAHKSFLRSFWGWQALVVLGVTFTVGIITTRFSLYELSNPDGLEGALRLLKGISNPDWSILPKAILNIIETIFMAFLATAFAIPVAFVLSFLAARNVMSGPLGVLLYSIIRTVLNITRSVEPLIWAIIFSVWVGIGPFAGMLALMIHSIASLTKQYSEMVESVGEGPIEGILATGANRVQMIWFAIVPQVVLPYISFTVYRWDINVRMATIIGLVGGGGIGTLLIQYQGQAMWPQVGCIIVVIAVVVWLLDQASAYLREALK